MAKILAFPFGRMSSRRTIVEMEESRRKQILFGAVSEELTPIRSRNNVAGAVGRCNWCKIEEANNTVVIWTKKWKQFRPLDEFFTVGKVVGWNKTTLTINNLLSFRTTVITIPIWPPTTDFITFLFIRRMFGKKDTPVFAIINR